MMYTHCYLCGKPLPHAQNRRVKCWACELERRRNARKTPSHIDRPVKATPRAVCELCGRLVPRGNPQRDVHHVDADHWNGSPENIKVLCRRCHMTLDGRLANLVARNEGGRKPVGIKTCPVCGKNFTRSSPSKLARVTYCSQHCNAVARERRIAAGKRTGTNRVCLACGTTFYVGPSERGAFCTRDCYLRYRREHRIGPTPKGYQFTASTSDSDRNHKDQQAGDGAEPLSHA